MARGRYWLAMDCDLSTSLAHVRPFLERALSGEHVVMGNRRTASASVTQAQPIVRKTAGALFTLLARRLLGMRISDFTCGFKLFSSEAGTEIFSRSCITGWAFDAEILFIATSLGFSVIEIPVTWNHDDRTKVCMWSDSLRCLLDLAHILILAVRGTYRP